MPEIQRAFFTFLYAMCQALRCIECPADLRYQSHALNWSFVQILNHPILGPPFLGEFGAFFSMILQNIQHGDFCNTLIIEGFPADRPDHREDSLSWVTESFLEFCHHESRSFSEGLFILLSKRFPVWAFFIGQDSVPSIEKATWEQYTYSIL